MKHETTVTTDNNDKFKSQFVTHFSKVRLEHRGAWCELAKVAETSLTLARLLYLYDKAKLGGKAKVKSASF